MNLHPNYVCQCRVPRPKIWHGEDSGLCDICSYVYDERLYEMRLRQHVPNFTYDSINDFLTEVDETYRSLAQAS